MTTAVERASKRMVGRACRGRYLDVICQCHYLSAVVRAVVDRLGKGVPLCRRADDKVGILSHPLDNIRCAGGQRLYGVAEVERQRACRVVKYRADQCARLSTDQCRAVQCDVEGQAQRVPVSVQVERTVLKGYVDGLAAVPGSHLADDLRVRGVVNEANVVNII